jgi:hypothetical protein
MMGYAFSVPLCGTPRPVAGCVFTASSNEPARGEQCYANVVAQATEVVAEAMSAKEPVVVEGRPDASKQSVDPLPRRRADVVAQQRGRGSNPKGSHVRRILR